MEPNKVSSQVLYPLSIYIPHNHCYNMELEYTEKGVSATMDEKVFISYSRKDTDWADRIKATLESNGVSCWMDRAGINAGEKYTREIINAIKRCDVFLLVLSPNAERSEWVPKELGKAIQYRKYIIPVKITDFEVEEFELQLENIQIFELDNLSEIQTQINLVNTVKSVLQLKPVDRQSYTRIPDEPSHGPAKGTSPSKTSFASKKRNFLFGGLLAAVLAVGILSGWLLLGKRDRDAGADPESQTIVSAEGETEDSGEERRDGKESGDSEKTGKQAEDNSDGENKEAPTRPGKAEESGILSDAETELCTLHVMNSVNAAISEKVTNSAGQTFDQAVSGKGNYSQCLAAFYLGGSYGRFIGTISCPDDVGNAGTWRFLVWLDEEKDDPVMELKLGRSTPPTLLDIDVTGHDTITFWAESGSGDTGFVVSDGWLYGTEGQAPQTAGVDNTTSSRDALLTSQHLMNSINAEIKKKAVNSAGQTFDQAVTAKGRYSQSLAAFYLGSSYSRFVGTLSCPDDVSGANSWNYKIWLDEDKDDPVMEGTMSRSMPPTLVDLDVTGHNTITFWVEEKSWDTGFMISDAIMYKPDDPAPAEVSVDHTATAIEGDLTSMHLMNALNARIDEKVTNSAGQTFPRAVTAKGRYSASLAAFYLGGGYSRFVGTLSCPEDVSGANTWNYKIWLDEEKDDPVMEGTMSRSTPPTLLDLDVTGHDTITFWVEEKSWDTGFMISDAILYEPGDSPPEAPEVDRTIPADSGELTVQHLMNHINGEIRKKAVNTAGQTFPQAVAVKGRYTKSFTTFYLGDNFTRFIGTLSCPDDLAYNGGYSFKVWLDGEEEEPVIDMTMSRATPPTLLDIDVTGHETITFWTEESSHDTGFMISDAWLYRSTDQIPESPSADNSIAAADTNLTSQHMMIYSGTGMVKKAVNSAGQTFDQAVVAQGRYAVNQATFYLGHNYSRLTGTISCPDQISHAKNFVVKIWLDDEKDEPVREFTMSRSMAPEALDIDVTGHETITFWAEEASQDTGFLISDGILIP